MVCLHIYFLCSALNFFKECLSPLGNLFKFLGYSKEWWERIIFYHILPLSSISYVWWLTKSSQWSCYRWPYLGSLPLAQGLSWLGQIDHDQINIYSLLQQLGRKCILTFFKYTWTFTKIYHIIGHKANINTFPTVDKIEDTLTTM